MFDFRKLRVAVIGAGRMGTFHAGVYSKMHGVELVAIVDTHLSKARSLASFHHCEAYDCFTKVIAKVDAVSITSCSASHHKIGIPLLTNGIHALIEKPLALCKEHTQQLLQAAAQSGVHLSVGHIEKFNPSFQTLLNTCSNEGAIKSIDVKRFGLSSNRISDTSVVMDLMIHDLELIFCLVNSPLKSLTAHGLIKGEHMQDYVCANLLFESGILATLLASRISSADIRSFNVSSSKGYYMVDSLQQSLKVLTKPASGRGQAIEEIPIHKKDALTLQLNHFVKCVRQQTHSNLESVIRALEVAWMIEKQLALEDQSLNTSPLEEAVQTTL